MKFLLLLVAIIIPAASQAQILKISNCSGYCFTIIEGQVQGPSYQASPFYSLAPVQSTNQVSYPGSDFVANAYADLTLNGGLSGNGLFLSATGNTHYSYTNVSANLSVDGEDEIQLEFSISAPCSFTNSTTLHDSDGIGNNNSFLAQDASGTYSNFAFIFGNYAGGPVSGPSSGSVSGTLQPGEYAFWLTFGTTSGTSAPISVSDNGNFSTFLSISPISPALKISAVAGGQAQISWSTNYSSFMLESASTVSNANWQPVTNKVVVAGQQCSVTVDTSGMARFFRLSSN